MKIVFLLCFLTFSGLVCAQCDTIYKNGLSRLAEFEGGKEKLTAFLNEHFNLDSTCYEEEGMTFTFRFYFQIDALGTVIDARLENSTLSGKCQSAH